MLHEKQKKEGNSLKYFDKKNNALQSLQILFQDKWCSLKSCLNYEVGFTTTSYISHDTLGWGEEWLVPDSSGNVAYGRP